MENVKPRKEINHGRRVNFERGCRINGQKGTKVEHFKIIYIYIYIYIYYTNKYIFINVICI